MSTKKELIVITGGAGGIGQACARAFKNQPLVITDYAQESVDKTVAILTKEGFDVSGIACDITDKNDIEKLVNYVSEKGTFKAVVHTAGISWHRKRFKQSFYHRFNCNRTSSRCFL